MKSIFYKSVPLFIIILILVAFIIFPYEKCFYSAIIIVYLILIILSIFVLCKCLMWYTKFMLENNKFKVDKPRVYFFSILLPPMVLFLNLIINYKSAENNILDILFCTIFFSLFIFTSFFLYYVLTPKFDKLLPILKAIMEKLSNPFTCHLDNETIGKYFDDLIKYNFLCYADLSIQKLDKQKFIEILISRKLPEETFLNLNMDNLQTYILYEEFEKKIKGFTLDHFLTIFKNKNDKMTKNSLIESVRKSIKDNIKEKNLIELIFKKEEQKNI